jgi:hypothetical protein
MADELLSAWLEIGEDRVGYFSNEISEDLDTLENSSTVTLTM